MAEKSTDEKESERFNSMLNAAQKQVGAQVASPSLSQAQIEAMLSDEDEGLDEPSPVNVKTELSDDDDPDLMQDDDAAIADRFREGIAADSQAAADEAEKKEKKKKEKKPKVKKEKKPLDKGTIAKILTAAAVVVAAALGYCVCLLFFSDVIKSPDEEFTIRAANALNSKMPDNTEMYVYKAYVRNGTSSDECMLYAVTNNVTKPGSDKTDMYRVVINHDEPNKINVYFTLDTENPEYIKMLESGDMELRVKASRLKGYSDDIAAADKEIQINSPEWHKINCNVVNRNIKAEEE